MQNRKPLKASLPHTVTVWNKIGEKVTNGAPKKTYQRTVLRHVRYEITAASTTQMAGVSRRDGLKLFIFNGVSSANNATYLDPKAFDASQNKPEHWTLRPGDYIALGAVDSGPEEGKITPYTVAEVQPCYGIGVDVHHWEVVGK